nr:hypothetical protein [Tanacetum cinerariifolium]
MARTPLNEHCSAVLLKKLPEKLGDPCKFLIPCDFLELSDSLLSHPMKLQNMFTSRSFLKTERALINVFEGELTLRVGKEAITFNLDQTSRYSANYSDMTAKRIDVIDMACEEYSQEVLGNYLPEVRKELKIYEAKSDKSSVDKPPEVELKDLPPHHEYAFLEGDDNLLVIIVKYLSVEEKTALITVLKFDKRTIAWKLSDIKGIDPEFCTHKILMEENFEPAVQHQRRVKPKIHNVIKQESCLSHLERMLKRSEDTNLYLKYEKSHFMVKEGIVLGHKISKQGIKVDKAKVDVITKLPHTTTVKDNQKKAYEAPILIASDWDMPFELICDASDYVIGAVLGKRQDKHFRPIHYASKTMTEEESNYATTKKEMLAVVTIWFANFENYHAGNFIVKGVYQARKPLKSSRLATMDPQEVTMAQITQPRRAVGENRASWSDKLDDALWAFWTIYKTPIRCTPYKLVYEKACHLPIELEHKAYSALKHANFDLKTARDHRKVQLRDQAYENSLIYKEKKKAS